jgi:hypothetical protein
MKLSLIARVFIVLYSHCDIVRLLLLFFFWIVLELKLEAPIPRFLAE